MIVLSISKLHLKVGEKPHPHPTPFLSFELGVGLWYVDVFWVLYKSH